MCENHIQNYSLSVLNSTNREEVEEIRRLKIILNINNVTIINFPKMQNKYLLRV
jgi:hypothetical protein